MPAVAKFMSDVPKIVISHSPLHLRWQRTTAATGEDLPGTVQRVRAETTGDIGVFGSSKLTAELLDHGLVDELRVIVSPVLLGGGSSLYAGLRTRLDLQPLATTVFRSGSVLLRYRPITATPS